MSSQQPRVQRSSATRVVFGIAVALVVIIGIAMIIPLGAEGASAVTGKHIWTLETVQYFVIPFVAFVVSALLLRRARRSQRQPVSLWLSLAAVLIVAAASASALVLFYRLMFTDYH